MFRLSHSRLLLGKVKVLLLAAVTGFWGCSQQSSRRGSVAYHNLTAHYNALVQARERLSNARHALFLARKDDYSTLLPIFPLPDSTQAGTAREDLNAVIKKASLVGERHQNSKYLDDAYLVLGEARLLLGDLPNASETFRYINTNETGGNARPMALIRLMETFTHQQAYDAALRAAEAVRQLPLRKDESREYYLTRAFLHQQRGEYQAAATLLADGLRPLRRGPEKARYLFILGQLHELNGQPAAALRHYRQVKQNNPAYPLLFHSELNTLFNEPTANVEAAFARMLEDRKNADLKDQVYAGKAAFEERQGDYPAAAASLARAAALAGASPQRPGLYLKLANLYFQPLGHYELARAYYDSTLAVQPSLLQRNEMLMARKKSLDALVDNLVVFRTEDSLQRLAALNPAELDRLLSQTLQQKKQQATEQDRLRQEQEARAQNEQLLATAGTQPDQPGATGTWYFHNPALVQRGRQEFTDRWGNRRLEDNWRRTVKENQLTDLAQTPRADSLVDTAPAAALPQSPEAAELALLRQTVPLSTDALAASRKKQEEALFEMGRAYQLGLNEPQKAVAAFEQLLQKFPQTAHEAETLYLLVLLTEGRPTQAAFKQKLTERYPGSSFVRLMNRPRSGPLDTAAQSQAQEAYAAAYELYQRGDYASALPQVENTLRQYPGSEVEDKLSLLRVMLLGKTQPAEAYRNGLNDFIQQYPASSLLTLARQMLAASEKGR